MLGFVGYAGSQPRRSATYSSLATIATQPTNHVHRMLCKQATSEKGIRKLLCTPALSSSTIHQTLCTPTLSEAKIQRMLCTPTLSEWSHNQVCTESCAQQQILNTGSGKGCAHQPFLDRPSTKYCAQRHISETKIQRMLCTPTLSERSRKEPARESQRAPGEPFICRAAGPGPGRPRTPNYHREIGPRERVIHP